MAEENDLAGRSILVVEDDYMIAADLADTLRGRGAEVIGPVPSVEAALQKIHMAPTLAGVLLDVNLRGEMAFPVADLLIERGVPFVFATGYDELSIPERYAGVTRYEKPLNLARIARTLFGC